MTGIFLRKQVAFGCGLALAWLLALAPMAEVRAESASALPVVRGLSLQNGERGALLELRVEGEVKPKLFVLENPERVVIDLPRTGWQLAKPPAPVETGVVRAVRYAEFRPDYWRVVLDMAEAHGVPELKVQDVSGLRLVQVRVGEGALPVSLEPASVLAPLQFPEEPHEQRRTGQGAVAGQGVAAGAKVTLKSGEGGFRPVPVAKPGNHGFVRAKPMVVIDPGHGGVDPGAKGVEGLWEKEITLTYAKALAAALRATGRYHVALTREDDQSLKLQERVAKARASGGALFISLHADSAPSEKARGLSVYTLSEDASDKEAEALAQRENRADIIVGVDLSDQSKDVAGILIDLAQRETMNRSAFAAEVLVEELGKGVSLVKNTHRFAGFVVLKSSDVPSVLVELGFLSNVQDERQLQSAAYRAKVTSALVRGVDRYFAEGGTAER